MKEFVDNVEVRGRHRVLNQGKVDALAASIKEIGLQTPIHVYVEGDSTILVAGHHRLAAVKRLDHEFIEVRYVELDALDRELWEIDENLIRAELTELERAGHLKRRKEIFDAKGEEKIPTLGGEQTVGFDRDTADKTGMDKSTIRKSRSRAEKIAEDVQEDISGTPIADSGVELDALKKLSHDEQRQAVKMVDDGSAKTIRDAHTFIKGETPEDVDERKRRDAAWSKFTKLTPQDRVWFFDKLKTSGFVK